MSDEPPGQGTSNKSFYEKLKNYFWPHSITGTVRRTTGIILVGGGVCYVPWLISDALSPEYPAIRVWLVLTGVFLLLAHIGATVIAESPNLRRNTLIAVPVIFLAVLLLVLWKRGHAPRETKPMLTLSFLPDGQPTAATSRRLDLTNSFFFKKKEKSLEAVTLLESCSFQ